MINLHKRLSPDQGSNLGPTKACPTSSLPLSCWTRIYPAFENSVDPDQLASEEANWSGSALFVIKYVNLYQQSGSSNLIGWELEMGVAS